MFSNCRFLCALRGCAVLALTVAVLLGFAGCADPQPPVTSTDTDHTQKMIENPAFSMPTGGGGAPSTTGATGGTTGMPTILQGGSPDQQLNRAAGNVNSGSPGGIPSTPQ